MRLQRFTKNPDERKRYGVDYKKWLDTSEKIVGITIDYSGGDLSLTVEEKTITADGKKITFFVGGGTAGKQYNVYIEISTSVGQIREDTMPFVVVAP